MEFAIAEGSGFHKKSQAYIDAVDGDGFLHYIGLHIPVGDYGAVVRDRDREGDLGTGADSDSVACEGVHDFGALGGRRDVLREGTGRVQVEGDFLYRAKEVVVADFGGLRVARLRGEQGQQ